MIVSGNNLNSKDYKVNNIVKKVRKINIGGNEISLYKRGTTTVEKSSSFNKGVKQGE